MVAGHTQWFLLSLHPSTELPMGADTPPPKSHQVQNVLSTFNIE